MSTLPDISVANSFARIREGDAAGFEAIYTRYYDRIYSIALQYSKVEETAEDVVQQVFLKVWEKRNTLAEINNPEAWLFTLARNQVLDVLKKQASSVKYKKYVQELFSESQETSPEHLLIIRQRKELLERSLQELSPKQLEVYRLNREKGMTYEEIAQHLGIGHATVKEHIANALAKIRRFLLEHKEELSLFILTCLLSN